ncbi:MAG: hypothetical protein SGJ09_16945 [Phycisphaerae bacterium]|nr:hypothetical protein [Phycisphaerae bacterium]
MADITDKKRVRQVAKQNLNESRVNDDFVFWMKTKGINWLLGILVVACAVMGWNWWKQRNEQAHDRSWANLSQAAMAEDFDEVAKENGGNDPIALFAWLKAGDVHLRDLQTGLIGGVGTPGPDGTVPAAQTLTPESRKAAQDSAEAYFQKALDGAAAKGDSPAFVTYRLSALFGKAAVAESRGDLDSARTLLGEAKAVAATPFPKFADQAQLRIDSLGKLAMAAEIPSRASLPAKPDAQPLTPSNSDDLINSLQGGTRPTPTPTATQVPVPTPNIPPPLLRAPPEAPKPATPPAAQPATPATTPPVTPPADKKPGG